MAPTSDAGGFGGVRGKSRGAVIQPAGDFRRSGQPVGKARDLGGLFRPERVALGRKKRFLIPAQKASRGTKECEFLPSGAKLLERFRDRRHGRMMKQENVRWNIFLLGLVRAVIPACCAVAFGTGGCVETPLPSLSF
jgi:hypothetical protein